MKSLSVHCSTLISLQTPLFPKKLLAFLYQSQVWGTENAEGTKEHHKPKKVSGITLIIS